MVRVARRTPAEEMGLRRRTPLIEPVVAERTERPTFIREMISVGWRTGDPIILQLVRPVGSEPVPVFLVLYSFPQSIQRFLDDRYCERLANHGCAVVGFESALTGDRYRNRPMKEWFVSELPESLTSSVEDVREIISYLQTRKDLDTRRVGMLGTGSGGSIALLASAVDPRIGAVDALNPWGYWPEWVRTAGIIPAAERAPLTLPTFLRRLEPLEPSRWIKSTTIPVRLQLVEGDANMPASTLRRWASGQPKNVQVARFPDTQAFAASTADGAFFTWISSQTRRALRTPPSGVPRPTVKP